LPEPATIVVIGSTGHFGGRICRRLVDEPNIELVVTSRKEADAARVAMELGAEHSSARIRPACLDQHSTSFEDDLRRLNPKIVLHTAGPYQGQDYRVAEACASCGSHYIDLADGREFVEGFSCLNETALQRDVLLVSGASTLPGLSSAVVDSLRDRFSQVYTIEISIAPAHQTPRGIGTVSAVLSYCGKPFQVLTDGAWGTKYGWQDLRVQRYPQLGTRLSGACDVPDLVLLPKYVDGVRTVTFHAALEAPWEQLTLWIMAWLTRLRVVRDWSRYTSTFYRISGRLISLGSDTGGMHIRLTGTDKDRKSKECTWHITAGQNHGPEIPCSPALVLARKLTRDEIPQRGAYACLGLMNLSDFELEVQDLNISWEVAE
jgi:hypothetical protein